MALSGTNGQPLFIDAELQATAVALDAAGFRLHAHVIGDGAVRQLLDALDGVVATNGAADRRPLLAHFELIDPADLPRLPALGAVANFTPVWAYPDTSIVGLTQPRIGPERGEWLYPIGAVAEAGATVVAGSEGSVSSMNPLEAIEVAGARATSSEVLTGTIEVGKLADLVVLDGDPYTVDPHGISDIEVVSTWLDGEPIYDANEAGESDEADGSDA